MANPLTLLMPVTPGVNPAAIAAALAKYHDQIQEALTSVGTVHYARFVLLDRSSASLQPGAGTGPFVLGVITEYDGDFNAYIQDFVAKVGTVFDALLSFTVGGSAITPVKDHIPQFIAYVAKYDLSQQPGAAGLYQAYPQTVQQILAAFD
jgi:hypothetical protein